MFTRRQLIATIGFGASGSLAYPAIVEPRWLELTHTDVKFGQSNGRPCRVLHLSDLHASSFVSLSFLDQAIQMGLQQKPDFICFTGDFITSIRGFDAKKYAEILRRAATVAPAYAVFGNHDTSGRDLSGSDPARQIVEQILKTAGITLLHNRSERIKINDRNIAIVGVGDLWTQEIDATSAFADIASGLPTLLLSHNPDSKTNLENQRWDVMLCGHTHGGQVLIPFAGPKYAPVTDKRYVAGLKPWRDRQIFVTRGVGNLGGVRFRCRPEVSLLSLL